MSLLSEASKAQNGVIHVLSTPTGKILQINRRRYGISGDRRTDAKKESALDDLLTQGLISDNPGRENSLASQARGLISWTANPKHHHDHPHQTKRIQPRQRPGPAVAGAAEAVPLSTGQRILWKGVLSVKSGGVDHGAVAGRPASSKRLVDRGPGGPGHHLTGKRQCHQHGPRPGRPRVPYLRNAPDRGRATGTATPHQVGPASWL